MNNPINYRDIARYVFNVQVAGSFRAYARVKGTRIDEGEQVDLGIHRLDNGNRIEEHHIRGKVNHADYVSDHGYMLVIDRFEAVLAEEGYRLDEDGQAVKINEEA